MKSKSTNRHSSSELKIKPMEKIAPKYDFDTHWKVAIKDLFEDFVAFFLPDLYPLIDFSQEPEFIEQELHEILPKGYKEGKAFGDKVAKVRLKNGSKQLILIHIEIQSSHDPLFLERMFTYYYRVLDKEQLPIVALAIYTDTFVAKNHNRYVSQHFNTKITYEFQAHKVIDYSEEALLASNNPFALVVLTCKYLNNCKKDSLKRFTFKEKLIIFARERNYSILQIVSLLRFIDLLMILPRDLQFKTNALIREKFLPMETTRIFKDDDYHLSNLMHEALYGETYDAKREREFLAAAKIFLQKGLNPKEIAEAFKLPLDKILNLLKDGNEEK